MYPLSRLFYGACQSLGISADYHEEDAGHDWFFWNAQVQRFLAAVLKPG